MNQTNLIVLAVVGAGLVLIPSSWWLPPSALISVLLAIGATAIIAQRWIQSKWVLPLAVMSLGASLSVWQVTAALSHRAPESLFGQDVVVTLKVRSVIDERPQRQIIIADTLEAPDGLSVRRWRIAWYGVPKHSRDRASEQASEQALDEAIGRPIELAVDDVWRMNLRLRSLTGTGNPGGFDVSGWYLRTHVDGAAYVRPTPAPVRLERGGVSSIDAWRASVAKRVTNLLPNDEFDEVVVALVLGFRAGVDKTFRELLVTTGTAHLLAISGLHIGLVSVAGFVLFKFFWSFFPNSIGQRYSRSAFAGFFSVCLALGYAVLAGLSPSTLRAVGMCAVGFFVLWQRRSVSLWLPFSISLALVVFSDVLRLLSPGVWLSYSAVALIIVLHRPNLSDVAVGASAHARLSIFSAWRTHAALGVCLLPMTGWFFSQGSLVAPIANLLAVPIVSFVVVPLCLLVVLLISFAPSLATVCLVLANTVIGYLEQWLTLCAAVPFADTPITVPSFFALATAILGVLCLCAPSAIGVRRYCLPLCLPVFIWSVGARQVTGLEVHVLDVGQGHASLVITENHAVLVDTGGTLGGGFTHWEATVLPALRQLGRAKITHVIVSHSDLDHSAGAEQLAAEFPEAEFWLGGVSAVANLPNAKRCVAGEHWRLDDVEFSFLHPARQAVESASIGQNVSDNDDSCVLLVQLGESTVLFPGDIEQRGEAILMQRLQHGASPENESVHTPKTAPSQALALRSRVTLLVAPHHGSRTSSTPEFVQGWFPEHVVFPAGYRNRLGFPHDGVRMRYKERGIVPYVTGRDGAVRFQIGRSGLLAAPSRYWDENRRLWHPLKR